MKNLITIGTFDGLHLGHQHLFNLLETRAALHRLKPLALYFPLPPKTLLSPRPEMSVLTLPDEKKALLKKLGMRAEGLDFNKLRNLSPQQFFNRLLNQFDCGGLLIGADFAFGKIAKVPPFSCAKPAPTKTSRLKWHRFIKKEPKRFHLRSSAKF